MKPMLAEDAVESKLRFPLIAQPKIDGVRGMNLLGRMTGRSLKPHANKYTTSLYSHSCLLGFDGELAAHSSTHPDLCRLTTSALSTIEGTPFTLWWLFDYVSPETRTLTYENRLFCLEHRVTELLKQPELSDLTRHLRPIEWVMCESLEQLLELDNKWLEEGYEGTIVRDPKGLYKQGRSTVKEGGLLRIKRFIESEAVVIKLIEGETNNNEAQTNELGLQFRSSHQENMVPNGQVGSMLCRAVKDVFDPQDSSKLLISKDQEITVAPGKMTKEERKHYFENPHLILDKVIKFQFFPKGVKDKPRFPTFQTFRAASDIGK